MASLHAAKSASRYPTTSVGLAMKAKREVLILAGYLAVGEEPAVKFVEPSLRTIVSRICADPGVTPFQIAQIAVMLAGVLDAEFG